MKGREEETNLSESNTKVGREDVFCAIELHTNQVPLESSSLAILVLIILFLQSLFLFHQTSSKKKKKRISLCAFLKVKREREERHKQWMRVQF